MDNQKLAKIISLDEYRKRDQPRYSEHERAVLEAFRGTNPAEKERAKRIIIEDLSLTVRIIEDKLRANGYPQPDIDRVGNYLAELQHDYPDLDTEQVSAKIWSMFNNAMQLTYEQQQAAQRKIEQEANRSAKIISILRNQDEK